MSNTQHLIDTLRARGYRFSKTRNAILSFLSRAHAISSAMDIKKAIAKKGVGANKTTIYRELALLKKEHIVQELQFGENRKKYELARTNHHHHIVCLHCEKIEDIALKKDTDAAEQKIAKRKKFKVLTHSLEFYGLCSQCK